jgi:hypothetical protein
VAVNQDLLAQLGVPVDRRRRLIAAAPMMTRGGWL